MRVECALVDYSCNSLVSVLKQAVRGQNVGASGLKPWIETRLARAGARSVFDGRTAMSAQEIERATPAAVLVPLVARGENLNVLLTQRTSHLANHAGQISFPGGRVDAQDADAEDTALRETHEEIGLARAHVSLLGRLPTYYIPTGFKVTPVVGWIEPPFALQLDAFEVAEAFEVPLDFFLDPINHKLERAFRNGREREFFAMPYEGRNIWGATAGMLVSLYDALTNDDEQKN
jgi:8-oxo-dGTP pyrophosphatase MutT (NUDIX family)